MSPLQRWCLIGVVAVGSGVAMFTLRTRGSAPAGATPVRLEAPAGAFDMGEIWESEEFAWTVPVENREPVAVEIEGYSASCACVAIEPQAFALGAGDRRDIRLTIDLSPKSKALADADVSVVLRPRLKPDAAGNARPGPEWKITGRVRRALAVDGSAYFGRHSVLAQPLPALSVPFDALVPLESVAASIDAPGFAATIDFRPPDQKNATLRVAATTPLPVGAFEATVSLRATRDGAALPPRRVRVAGRIVPDVEPDPPAVQVGGRRIGEAFEEVVSVRSLTGRAVKIVRVEVEGEGLTVAPAEEAGWYRVRQTVRRSGTQTNHVRFAIEPIGSQQTVDLPVSYTGFEAE